MKSVMVAALIMLASPVEPLAHDVWADGSAIPAWVKSACCGPSEAHRLMPDQVRRISEDLYGIEAAGRYLVVAAKDALPSQDASYWIFYNNAAERPVVHCFFLPMSF